MPLLASDVMDDSAVILNDVSRTLYSYTVQLPLLKFANRDLELLLINHGIPVTRERSASIDYTANSATITLPSDFLFPIKLFERADGSSDPWVPMIERDFESNTVNPQTTLTEWAFRDGNTINVVPCTVARDVQLLYERQIAVITSQSSSEEIVISRNYLAAKTAEYCARFIGRNEESANSIRDNESFRAQDALVRSFVLNEQGVRYRRPRFTTRRLEVR